MPRKKARTKRAPDHQLLIFEISAWEPSYAFSLNRSGQDESDYSEFAELHLDTACVYPEPLAGRKASMIFSGRRGLFDKPDPRRDPRDKPYDVGLLQLSPSRGSFYAGVPHDTIPFLMSGIAVKQFRFVMVAGPPLKKGHMLATELYFSCNAD